MAYRSRRYSRRRSYRARRSYRSYGRRAFARRRTRRTTRARTPRVVIQVVGGAGGVAASPMSLGMKAAVPVRRRY